MSISIYTSGDVVHKCHVSTCTIQYYDKQGILSPNYTTETSRRFYTDKEVEKLELILLLKEMNCIIKEIKVLLEDDSSMKSLYTFLQIKKHEIQESVTDKESRVCKTEQIQRYVHQNSISPIYYLQDIAIYMEESYRLKGVRKKLWLSIALIGSLQYDGLITSIVTQRKKPSSSMMPVVAIYSLWLTKKYKRNISYVCPNYHHVFNPSVIHFVTASHTPKTRKFQCLDCHGMHYCVEIAKQ